ncbi:MAG TPA: hypothetical protein VMA34_11795 [Terracidiphilus sp.]|nr:hypothetical protein [Terracidiphilus sp.]
MRLLLDSRIYLRVADQSPELTEQAREVLESASAIYVSWAGIWEIAIKVRRGKLRADPEAPVAAIETTDSEELPVLACPQWVLPACPCTTAILSTGCSRRKP